MISSSSCDAESCLDWCNLSVRHVTEYQAHTPVLRGNNNRWSSKKEVRGIVARERPWISRTVDRACNDALPSRDSAESTVICAFCRLLKYRLDEAVSSIFPAQYCCRL